MNLDNLLQKGIELGASDVHIQAGSKARLRIHGRMHTIDAPPLKATKIEEFIHRIIGERRWEELQKKQSVDCAYHPGESVRFRVNAYYQRETISASIRILNMVIPPFEELNLPPVIKDIADEPRGLILVTGTTGSGKTTTIAAMIDHINSTEHKKIITIEDPIEYAHQDKKSLMSQREVGVDTPSFSEALRRALRQDPDVILVGEIRDTETLSTAIRAADTGHLVFSTVHTTNATQTLQRVVAMFPPAERDLLTIQLATNLIASISLRLAQRADGKGRVPAAEIMRDTPIVEKLISEHRFIDLAGVLASGERGMPLFDQHLAELAMKGIIANREALSLATSPERVGMILSGMSSAEMAGGIISSGS